MCRAAVLRLVLLVVSLAAARTRAEEPPSPLVLAVSVEAVTLTDFGGYFSLPVGLRLGGDYRLFSPAPGLDLVVGAELGWWMESFRDTFHFQPEVVPVMVPLAATVGLRWRPTRAVALEAGLQAGGVLEFAPRYSPALLGLLSPGAAISVFFGPRVGLFLRAGWTWAGAAPLWGGPSLRLGLVLR